MADNKSTSGGIGFTSLLLLLFIGLKLGGVINWSWLWVLSPFWIPLSLVILLLAFWAVIKLIEKPKEPVKSKWQERLEQVQAAQKRAQDAKQNN